MWPCSDRVTTLILIRVLPSQVKNFKPRVIPKDAATNASLERSLGKNILFSHLDDDERKQIFDAMELHECKPGDVIIKQGQWYSKK